MVKQSRIALLIKTKKIPLRALVMWLCTHYSKPLTVIMLISVKQFTRTSSHRYSTMWLMLSFSVYLELSNQRVIFKTNFIFSSYFFMKTIPFSV